MLNKTTLLASSAALAMLVSTPAFAQMEEVITTATKRSTTLQETPVTVSVTSADVIQKARIEDLGDLQTVTPTLRVSQLQNSGNTSFSLRGFGNGTNNVGLEPSVGVFIDGVYRSRAAASINNLPNLERVEVLPGPQSTLFGKNASGGVISIVTAKPSFDTSGYVQGGLGNNALKQAKGYITGAVGENVAISLGGSLETADGYFDTEGASDINETKRSGVRGQILWEPADNISLRLIADGGVIDENCCGTTLAISGPVSAGARAAGFLPADTDPYSYQNNANQDANNEIRDKGISLHADIDFDKYTLTNITALRQNEWFYDSDSDFSSRDILRGVFQDVNTDTFSQELRLTSDFGGPLEFMLGGYYFQEDLKLQSGAYWGDDARGFVNGAVGGANGAAVGNGVLNNLGAVNGVDPALFYAADAGSTEFFEQDDEAYSVFGTVDYDVTDRLVLTGGLNYTTVEKQVSSRAEITDPFAFIDLAAAPSSIVTSGVAAQVFNGGLGTPGSTAYVAFAENITPLLAGSPLEGAQFTQATIDALNSSATTAPLVAGFRSALQDGVVAGLQGVQFLIPSAGFPNNVEDGNSDDSKLTWNIRAAYELNDNINIYASAATGFKSSSWNLTRDTRPSPSDIAALDMQNISTVNQTTGSRFAKPEESEVIEVGLKARFEQGAFNIAAFNQSIENFQAAIFQGAGFFLANADKATTRGIEFDSTYVPNEAWRFTFAGTLLDAEYDKFENAFEGDDGNPVDLSGETPSGVPEVALATSVTYSHDFGAGRTGYIRAEHQFESEVQILDNLSPDLKREVNNLNGSLGFTFANDVAIQVWARNILEDETANSGFPTPLISAIEKSIGVPLTGRSTSIYPNQPRTYGVNIRKSF